MDKLEYYQKRDELFKKFISEDCNEDQLKELLNKDAMFKQLFECILRGQTPYWAMTILAKQLIESDKKLFSYAMNYPQPITHTL